MKTSNIVGGMIVGLIGIATATAADAADRIVVRVPFNFIVGTTELPAGNYVVTENANDTQGLLSIESADGRRSMFALTMAAMESPASQTGLVFDKFEDRYFLSKVASDGGVAREIPLSHKLMEKDLAQVHVAATSSVTP